MGAKRQKTGKGSGPVYALRMHLDWGQQAVVVRANTLRLESGKQLTREELSKVESGANKASSHDMRRLLAHAFGVDVTTFAAYLKGKLSMEAVLAHRAEPPSLASRKLRDRDGWEAAVAASRAKYDYISEASYVRAGAAIDYGALPDGSIDIDALATIARGFQDAWRAAQQEEGPVLENTRSA